MIACSGGLDEPVPTPDNQLQGQVVISGPLRGARLSVDQLDLETGEIRAHIGDTTTNDEGRFSLSVGAFNGVLLITSRGGLYDDLASGATLLLDPNDELRTVTTLSVVEERDDVLVGPVGHMVAARLPVVLPTIDSTRPEPVFDAFAVATNSLSGHFGRVVDWTRLKLVGLDQKATSPTEPLRAALVHAALSYLAHDIAVAADASPQEVNVLALTRHWATDISIAAYDGDPLVFDGQDRNAKGTGLQLGACPPATCMPDQQMACGGPQEACRTLCDLYSGTVRAILGGELTKIIANPEINRTELNTADILPVARAISENADSTLFGPETCTETLDRVPPAVLFDASTTPAEGALVRGGVTVKATASDDVGVADLVIETYPDADGDPSNTTAIAVIDTTTITDRALVITATATDRAGNKDSATRTLLIDNTPPELAVEDAGFVVQTGVRWSSVAAPTVSGTASDAHGATVRVSIAGNVIAMADVIGGTWSVALPAAMLGTSPTEVTFAAADPLGNASTPVVRRFAVDTTPPLLSVMPTTVKNETNDIITFAPGTGTPSHAHTEAGKATLDGNAGCPDVFKHAYLMEPDDPNPIRWQLRAVDDGIGLAPESARYRIGRDDGTLVGPWRPALGTLSGNNLDLPIDAVRSGAAGDAFLGTTEAVMAIDLEVADQLGRTSLLRRCWTHHPLAVPLDVTNASVAAGHRLALSSNKLEAGAPFRALAAELINSGSKGLSLMDYDLTNGTLETSFVTFTLSRPPTSTRRDYVKQSAILSVTDLGPSERIECDVEPPSAECGIPTHPPRGSNVGSTTPVPDVKYAVRVLEIASDGSLGAELACLRCEATSGIWQFALAGKLTANAPARRYRVMTVLRELQALAPSGAPGDPDPGPFVDTTVGVAAVGITGRLLIPAYTGCTRFETVVIGPVTDPEFRRFCTQQSTFQFYRALTRVEIILADALRNQPSAAPTSALVSRSDGLLKIPQTIEPIPGSYTTTETLPPTP